MTDKVKINGIEYTCDYKTLEMAEISLLCNAINTNTEITLGVSDTIVANIIAELHDIHAQYDNITAPVLQDYIIICDYLCATELCNRYKNMLSDILSQSIVISTNNSYYNAISLKSVITMCRYTELVCIGVYCPILFEYSNIEHLLNVVGRNTLLCMMLLCATEKQYKYSCVLLSFLNSKHHY